MIIIVSLLSISAFPMMASNSLAHLPAFDTGGDSYEDAEWIDDLVTSYAFYGEVPAMTPCDPSGAKYYVFEGRSGEEFRFEVGVPVHSALAKPCILLLGPGLPNPDEIAQNIIDSSNLTIPEGYGAMGWAFVIRPDADYYIETQFEPFTQTVFAYAYQKDILLPSDGTYYIVFTSIVYSEPVHDYQISPCKYFLVTGNEEDFTAADFVLMPWYWLKVQSYWGSGFPMFFFALPFAIIVSVFAADAWRRREDVAFLAATKQEWLLYFMGITGPYLMVGFAANQIWLITFHDSYHHWEGIVLLVFAIQLAGAIIGIISYMFFRKRFFSKGYQTLIISAAIAVLALLIGAGLIVGPLLFFSSMSITMLYRRRQKGT